MLTSCGMAVIFTARASHRPAPPPMTPPTAMTVQFTVPTWCCASRTTVAITATAMPPAEIRLPRRAVAGAFIRCRPRTKPTAAST